MRTAKETLRTELEYVSEEIQKDTQLNYVWPNVLNALVFLETEDYKAMGEQITEAKHTMVNTCTGNWFRIFNMLDVIEMAVIREGVE